MSEAARFINIQGLFPPILSYTVKHPKQGHRPATNAEAAAQTCVQGAQNIQPEASNN